MTAGNLNRVNLQSLTWSGRGQITSADITFRNAAYAPTSSHAAGANTRSASTRNPP